MGCRPARWPMIWGGLFRFKVFRLKPASLGFQTREVRFALRLAPGPPHREVQGFGVRAAKLREAKNSFQCPQGQQLRHTTTGWDGKRIYRSTPKICRYCPCCQVCGANVKGQRIRTTHIWREHLDLVEQLRKTLRGLARVALWGRLKFVAMSLKMLALSHHRFPCSLSSSFA